MPPSHLRHDSNTATDRCCLRYRSDVRTEVAGNTQRSCRSLPPACLRSWLEFDFTGIPALKTCDVSWAVGVMSSYVGVVSAHGFYIRSIKFPSRFKGVVFMGHEKFTKHWKLISWATKLLSISDWKNSWPMKVQRPPSIYFMGHENYNWPWDTHVSNSWSRSRFPVLSHSVIPNYRCPDFA